MGEMDGDDYATHGKDLQQVVDEAGVELGFPVALEDRNLRLLAFSAHEERDIDPVRASTILKRVNSDQEVIAWFNAHGALAADHPTRVRANLDLGLRARVCAPVRCQGYLLGYLWMTDEHESATPQQLARMEEFANAAGVIIYRDRLLRSLHRGRERELFRDILSDEEQVRVEAASQLVDLGVLEADGPVVVIAGSLAPLPVGGLAEPDRAAVDAALGRIRWGSLRNQALLLMRADHVAMLVSLAEPWVKEHGVVALARRVQSEITKALSDGGSVRNVAIGGSVGGLAEARTSYKQSQQALSVMSALHGRFGDCVAWDELGVYRLLIELSVEQLGPEVIHPGIQKLLSQPSTHFLLDTLEVYLDSAGDAQKTATDLHVHRTTLHHRLRRVQELAQVNLHSGDERLALHLALKLARLQGHQWSAAGSDAPNGR